MENDVSKRHSFVKGKFRERCGRDLLIVIVARLLAKCLL